MTEVSNIDLVNTGKICPYCNKPTEYVDSSCVYNFSYRMIYVCKECDAYVGVHKGTDLAKGRLANKELRAAKIYAHDSFDKIARTGLINKIWKEFFPGISNRQKAYRWLSKQMNIPEEKCHIGMFDVEDCKRVVEICSPYLETNQQVNQFVYSGYESAKMIEAKKEIVGLGYQVTNQTQKELQIIFKNNIVRYYPDSEWHSGKSIIDGRGLYRFLAQLINEKDND